MRSLRYLSVSSFFTVLLQVRKDTGALTDTLERGRQQVRGVELRAGVGSFTQNLGISRASNRGNTANVSTSMGPFPLRPAELPSSLP